MTNAFTTPSAPDAVPFTEIKCAMVAQNGSLAEVKVAQFTFEADSPENMFYVRPFHGRRDYNIPVIMTGHFVQFDGRCVAWCMFEVDGLDLVPTHAVFRQTLVPLLPVA